MQDSDVKFNESLREKPSTSAIASDRHFLQTILAQINRLSISIPHIQKQAELAEADQEFQLYSENTCQEFHRLFLEILTRFRTSLSDLKKFAGAPSTPSNEEFKESASNLLAAGYWLLKLSTGAALPMHLKTIEAQLDDPRRADMSMPMPRGNAEMDEEQGEEQDERDEELQAVQPSAICMKENKPAPVPVPLWKSYRNWLRLMMVHFEAASILAKYVTRSDLDFHTQSISLQILVAPSTDKALLPWRELFTDSKLFPTGNEVDSVTNDDILIFLGSAANSNTKQCLLIKAVGRAWADKNKELTLNNLRKLEGILPVSETSSWLVAARRLVQTITDHYENPPADEGDEGDKLSKIAHTIESLYDSGRFFAFLSEKNDFKGTLHCEACLTSLLPHHFGKDVTIDSIYEGVLPQVKVCYVVSGWFYQQIFISDNRIVDELSAYRNAAVRRVDTSSSS